MYIIKSSVTSTRIACAAQCTLSLRRASIIATVCLLSVTYPLASGCNESRTRLSTSSSTLRHGHHLHRYSNNYTGYPMNKQGSPINCVCLCTVLSIEWHRFIYSRTLPAMHRSTSSIRSPRRFRDTKHQPSFHEQFIFYRCTNCLEQTTYTHSYLYNSVIVSIQTQDSPVHYIICCSLGLYSYYMYGAPELWLWGALGNAILIG